MARVRIKELKDLKTAINKENDLNKKINFLEERLSILEDYFGLR
jgi:hypothetical protein